MTSPFSGQPVAFIQVADRERGLSFYRDTLGLPVRSTDEFGTFLEAQGALIRLTAIPEFQAHGYPLFGWNVEDIEAAVRALVARGIAFTVYDGMGQDALGVWTSPDGASKVAWFADPDGNVLSLSQA